MEHGSTSSRPEADDAAEHAGGGAGEDGTDEGLRVRVGTIDGGFYVADDGPGVPPEDGERVFEPGYSAHENGTGLGLTIVRRIAGAHGWTVSLTTGDDGGARFEFRGLADPGG